MTERKGSPRDGGDAPPDGRAAHRVAKCLRLGMVWYVHEAEGRWGNEVEGRRPVTPQQRARGRAAARTRRLEPGPPAKEGGWQAPLP